MAIRLRFSTLIDEFLSLTHVFQQGKKFGLNDFQLTERIQLAALEQQVIDALMP
jgi:hypothetical protein